MATPFKPFHINATTADLAGNQGIGRYIFLPGSDDRAKEIATHFSQVTIKQSPRGHHLYLGTLHDNEYDIAVASISTGMGCPSAEIILHELYHLGAKRFLRVGTAGSLQPYVAIGDIVNIKASVRDESSSKDYVPIEFPAVAADEMLTAIHDASAMLANNTTLHTGIAHCKSTFYAREFATGPLHDINENYMKLLSDYGVLATEMESAILFTQAQTYDQEQRQLGSGASYRVYAGGLLGIIVVPPHQFATPTQSEATIKTLIQLALATVKSLANLDRKP